jgi:hypothetical protein
MIDMECITLGGVEYAIIERINYNNNEYVYLANTNVDDDVMFRKVTIEDNETYYSTLDSDEEFDNVVRELGKKLASN